MLPQISPSPLTFLKEPIGHPKWVNELKHDGFRGILYVDREQAWLVSRKGKKFRQFEPLLKQVLRCLKGQRAILDGEIVVLDEKGRSNFFDLTAHRGEPRYYGFDLLWLNGVDLRSRPLQERKKRLHRLIPAQRFSPVVRRASRRRRSAVLRAGVRAGSGRNHLQTQDQHLPVYLDQGQESQLLTECRAQGMV